VLTHLRCNQACTFCTVRQAQDAPAFIARPAVERRIDAAIAAGARTIALSGGEPTMRADLSALVRHARDGGAAEVRLDTNGTLLDEDRIDGLVGAGLTLARVHLSGWGEALDAVTRDPGGFQTALRGLDALVARGVELEIAAAVTRSTAPLLPDLPTQLRARYGERCPAHLVLSVPVSSPDPRELLAHHESTPVVAHLERVARQSGISVKLDPGASPPPCAFSPRDRPHHLYSLTAGASPREDHVRLEPCARCLVNDRCSGVARAYLERFPAPVLAPIGEERARRRLSLISTVRDQIARELVTHNVHQATGVFEEVVRVNFQCNQACRFCFVSTHLPAAGEDAVRAAIAAAADRGAKIVLSGGEPTLNPRLVDYVALAKSRSDRAVELQTNAIRLDDPALCDALVEAGLGEVFVSLHGSRAEISDAVTSAPGTFARTVVGIDNLHRREVVLRLNFVLCATNLTDLVPYVEMVAGRWPRASITFSFVAPSTDVVPRDAEMIPRYSEAMPAIAAAVARAGELGIEIRGFESMCGLPLCLVPSPLTPYLELGELPVGFDRGEFRKTSTCRGCALEQRCYGLRRGYAELYGDSELRRIGPDGKPVP
jgi:MoaA/NifB/PqqE/SkfB family radical SAM enzyme